MIKLMVGWSIKKKGVWKPGGPQADDDDSDGVDDITTTGSEAKQTVT